MFNLFESMGRTPSSPEYTPEDLIVAEEELKSARKEVERIEYWPHDKKGDKERERVAEIRREAWKRVEEIKAALTEDDEVLEEEAA